MWIKSNGWLAQPAWTLIIFAAGILSSISAEAQIKMSGQKKQVCSSYDPRPGCTEDERNARRKQFALPTLEKIRRQYGRANSELIVATVTTKLGDGLALVFQRDRDGTPSVEIHTIYSKENSPWKQALHAKISEGTWDTLLVKGNALNLVFARDEVILCGGSYMVELMDREGNIRAPVGDSCGGEPRSVYFNVLAEAAIAQLPHCAALAPDSSDRNAEKLMQCFVLQGDKMAVAELYNFLHSTDYEPFWEANARATSDEVKPLFDKAVEFSWPGIPLIEEDEVAANFWSGAWLWPLTFEVHAYHAETASRVRVEGKVFVEHETADERIKKQAGPFTSIWLKGADGKFRMHSFVHSTKRGTPG